MPGDDDQRRRLEAAAPLLELTRGRLEALVLALERWRWRAHLKTQTEALDGLLGDPPWRPVLARAQRRAAVEGWTLPLLDEVAAWSLRLDAVLARRGYGTLAALRGALFEPGRAVAVTERDTAASAALGDEAELGVLRRFGEALERAFGNPTASRSEPLRLTLAELDEVIDQWAAGTHALETAWGRVAAVDPSGGVARTLKHRARLARPLVSRGRRGPAVLAYATAWHQVACAQLEALVDERMAPLRVAPHERWACLRYVVQRQADPDALLGPTPRDALLMLAHALSAASTVQPPRPNARAQFKAWASLADTRQDDNDWARLRDALRVLAAQTAFGSTPPLYRVGKKEAVRPLGVRLVDFFP